MHDCFAFLKRVIRAVLPVGKQLFFFDIRSSCIDP
jgi:hypothetical protein